MLGIRKVLFSSLESNFNNKLVLLRNNIWGQIFTKEGFVNSVQAIVTFHFLDQNKNYVVGVSKKSRLTEYVVELNP